MMRKVLITGGFGYLGGRLAQFLASQDNYKILLGSRRQTQPPPWLQQAKVVETRWGSLKCLEEVCSGVDAIVHLAGMNAQDCAADPEAALEVNAVATTRLLQAAICQKVKRFIYMSTAHVYGSPLGGDITEKTNPTGVHPYASSHRAGEDAVSQFREIEGIVIRLSNAYGTPVDKDVNCWMLLVNDLCKQAVQTGRLVLQTSGLQQRDFIGLTEVCRVTEHFSVGHSESKPAGVFNVGAGMSQSVLEIAQLIQKRCEQVLGFEPLLQFMQEEVNEQHPLLTYQSNNLSAFGINSNGIVNTAEIDSLLRFCQTAFT